MTTYFTIIITVLIINAVIGITAFNWAWKKSDRFRNPNEKLLALFPAYRRSDAERWTKWKFLLGSVILFVPRLIWFGILLSIFTLFMKVLMIGQAKD